MESKLAKSISLLLGVHAHQPVGNFSHVLDDAHQRCYKPFLEVVHRYPDFKFAFHMSGWLLDYLLERYPEDMRLLREMVGRGQAELFGAGYTEPVLAVIPYRDRVGQLQKMSSRLEESLGQTPEGAWLTERVWEATVIPALADSKIRYTTVDDYHFLCAGKSASELDGFYTTEEDGRQLDLFPISEALRYRLPFSPAQDAIAYLEAMASDEGEPAAIYFDDIEKFGIWPETYEWVYEKGWLKDFIEGVLASPVISPMSYRDYHARARTRGVIYLPTTSYIEMNEWTLPVPAAYHYADLVHQAKSSGNFERDKAFLRGGIWKNFFSRYPESNWMHKRMLALSTRFDDLPAAAKTAEMRQTLYEAQSNDAYWHGLFGGLYLPHLRRAIYNAIVKLEGMLDRASQRGAKEAIDLDLDGVEEVFVQNGVLQAVVKLDGSASVGEFDCYSLNHNFADTLSGPAEHYHRKITQHQESEHSKDGIASPHDRTSFKHVIRPEDLVVGDRPKTLFLDAWVAQSGVTEPQYRLAHSERDAHGLSFQAQLCKGEVKKRLSLSGSCLSADYEFADMQDDGVFCIEINLAMPSCDGPAGRIVAAGEIKGGFGQEILLYGISSLRLEDEVLGGALALDFNQPLDFHSRPYFSVSQSEAGFEKIMQSATLTLKCEPRKLSGPLSISIDVR